MPRIEAIEPSAAGGKARQLLEGVQAKLGITPNMMRTLASAPAVLEGYLKFGAALESGSLGAKLREQIAITVAQANSCEYCLSAHSAIGKLVGLNPSEIAGSREAHSEDVKSAAGLRFAQAIVVQRGEVSDAALTGVRNAGYSDAEITEIIANVAINIFTNYFNLVAQTEVDFPRVPVAMATRQTA